MEPRAVLNSPGMIDTAIIGLGIAGSAILARLAATQRVIGIDRFAPPHAHGSSHGENRIIRGAPGEGAVYAELAARAFALFADLEKTSGRVLLHMTGGFDSALAPSDWAAGARAICETYALPYEALTGRAFNARHPHYCLPADAEVILQPRFGHVAAEASWQAFLDLARARGAQLRLGTAVREIALGDPHVVTLDDGTRIEAGALVLAAGSWLNELIDLPLALRPERRVLAWYRVEKARGPLLPFCYVDGPREGFWYGMPAEGGTALKMGEHHHLREPVTPGEVQPVNQADRDLLNGFIARHTTGLAPEPFATATCIYTMTPSEDFILDRHPQHETVLIVSCCSGHGFKYAPVYGEIAEAMLAGRTYPTDLSRFSIAAHRGAEL